MTTHLETQFAHAHLWRNLLVTPTQAQQWLTENLYDRQRPRRPYRVKYLLQLMQAGHFRRETVLTFAVHGRQHFLVNGQHTLEALVQFGQPFPLTIEDYPCATMADVDQLYGTFDRNLSRTPGDVYTARRASGGLELNPSQVRLLATAIPLLTHGFENDGHMTQAADLGVITQDPEWRLQHMQAWGHEARLYFGAVARATHALRPLFSRAGVLAVGLVTLRHCQATAQAFWTEVAQDEGLKTGMPSKALLRWLVNTPVVAQRFHYSRYVATAWNAFVEGRELTVLKPRVLDAPIRLAGTPHTGGQILRYVDADFAPIFMPVPKPGEA